MILSLLKYLLLTILVEGVLMAFLTRSARFVYYSVLCNLLTNPLVNYLLLLIGQAAPEWYPSVLIALECAAVFTEGLLYLRLCDFSRRRAFLTSLLLNAASFAVGLLLIR